MSQKTKTLTVISARVLLGLVFLVFGLNAFFNFIPSPPLPEAAGKWLGGVSTGGYFIPFLKITEIALGIALLTGYFVPLSLVILMPISINILLFHAFLEGPQTIVMPVIILILHIYLAWSYRDSYKQLFSPKLAL